MRTDRRFLPKAFDVVLTAAALIVLCVAWRPRVTLIVSPTRLPACQTVPVSVDIAWNAPYARSVGILIYQLGDEPKLWLATAAQGSAKTGPWIMDGTTVLLTDQDGRRLARRTLESEKCPLPVTAAQ
ncbi:hypothetical protein L2Y94_04060 [Luteibacter aegosomatis]|uniref:hypothetical protein n=1 Tax=Luteibacter aegosomatis TaxID=2911537 RepID=UPI001FF9DE41|nr:hypothetical protein [Luteibacter aegosomatis]UPG86542.1 hypothetical protein L2Y94_04060 [Luteibacter aegosomatis]